MTPDFDSAQAKLSPRLLIVPDRTGDEHDGATHLAAMSNPPPPGDARVLDLRLHSCRILHPAIPTCVYKPDDDVDGHDPCRSRAMSFRNAGRAWGKGPAPTKLLSGSVTPAGWYGSTLVRHPAAGRRT